MQQNKEKRWVKIFIISTFVALYAVVSLISTIHVIDFFRLSNPDWLAISLAIGFELGAAASLASLIALRKMNKSIVWVLFFILTGMQAMGNTYYAFSHLKDFTQWSELFGLIEEEIIYQKRVLSIISGAILPLVALGFIKSLVDYIKPEEDDGPQTVGVESSPMLQEIAEPETQEIPIQKEENKTVQKIKEEEIEISKPAKKGFENTAINQQIDLGSSETQVEETDEQREKSNWHRIFNNDTGPENLK